MFHACVQRFDEIDEKILGGKQGQWLLEAPWGAFTISDEATMLLGVTIHAVGSQQYGGVVAAYSGLLLANLPLQWLVRCGIASCVGASS